MCVSVFAFYDILWSIADTDRAGRRWHEIRWGRTFPVDTAVLIHDLSIE